MGSNQCRLRHFDTFHVKYIRRISKIAPSYFSRISNDDVLNTATCIPLSTEVKKHQLKLFGPSNSVKLISNTIGELADLDFAGLTKSTKPQLLYVVHSISLMYLTNAQTL